MNQREKSSLTKEFKSKNTPIKYLVFTFLLANMELPSHTPCPSVLRAVPRLSFSPVPPLSLPPPMAEQHQAAAVTQSKGFSPGLDLCTGHTPPPGTSPGGSTAALHAVCPFPCPGTAQRRHGSSLVSCYVPDPGSSPQQRPHASTQRERKKKKKIIQDIQLAPAS